MAEPRVYDHIISLGYDCRVAYNLRNTFGFERAFPFDWWVTPFPALLAFLREPSLDRLYDERLLEGVTTAKGLFAIRNAHYDIELHHEFPRHPKTNLVLPDWRDHIPKARDRTDYLLRRFLEAPPGSRLLFVRYVKKPEARSLGDRMRGLIDDLHHELVQLFPRSDLTLLVVDPPGRFDGPGVANLWIGDQAKADWRGAPELWTKGLLDAGFAWSGSPSAARMIDTPEADHDFLVTSGG